MIKKRAEAKALADKCRLGRMGALEELTYELQLRNEPFSSDYPNFWAFLQQHESRDWVSDEARTEYDRLIEKALEALPGDHGEFERLRDEANEYLVSQMGELHKRVYDYRDEQAKAVADEETAAEARAKARTKERRIKAEARKELRFWQIPVTDLTVGDCFAILGWCVAIFYAIRFVINILGA